MDQGLDFEGMGLDPKILRAIDYLEFEAPTPIQAKAIPLLLDGRDVVGQAKTGTGKTAAFVLPLLHTFDPRIRDIQALVVTPTRELAIQIAKVIREFARYMRLRVLTIYGGHSYGKQIRRLQRGVDIVVGTPGRLLDLIKQNILRLGSVGYVVLDEADEMLGMGFIEDVETILEQTSPYRQTALFSATIPERIRLLANHYMRDPEIVIGASPGRTVKETEQRYFSVDSPHKFAVLLRVLYAESVTKALIFTRTRIKAAELAEDLRVAGLRAEAIHGDLNQRARERVMGYFRHGPTQILVATDVAARGLDVMEISHVVNYDIPLDPKMYVHRIGRTGRAGREGVAISLVIPGEIDRLRDIEAYTLDPIVEEQVPTVEEVLETRRVRLRQMFACRLESAGTFATEIVSKLSGEGYSAHDIAIAATAVLWDAQCPTVQALRYPETVGATKSEETAIGGRDRFSRRHMVTLVMTVGHNDGVRPADVVRTLTARAGLDGRDIGLITINPQHTYIDVHEYRAAQVLRKLPRFEIRGHKARLYRDGPSDLPHG